MPSNLQTIPQKLPSLPMPSPHSYTVMQFRSIQNDDEDDICPVCESECTCGNTNNIPPATSQRPTAPSLAPTLKIKLPPRRPANPSPKRTRPKLSKQKSTTADSATVGGTAGLSSRPGPFSAPGHQLRAPPPTASISNQFRDGSPLTPEPELELPIKARSKPKQSAKSAAPKNRKKLSTGPSNPKSRAKSLTTKKTSAVRARSKKKKDATWTAPSARKGKTVFQPSSDESHDNPHEDEDAYVSRMRIDSDGESVQFPTFISAISTTSGNDNDSASMNSDSFDSDSSVRAEEEDMILAEQRAKVRREIFNGDESWHMEKRKWDHLKNNNNWEIRPRKKSVSAGESESDSESGSGTEAEEEDDDEAEADDDDPDIRYGRGMVTGWQSDDDDFDAELFFATLTDSSAPGSEADAEDGEESDNDQSDDNSDLSSISITEAAAAGLLTSPFGPGCPLVVTEDWDGRLVFANGLEDGQGVLDAHFEVNAARRHRAIREVMEVVVDETEDNMPEGEDDEEDLISDGETTDDMLDNHPGIHTPHGVVPLPFRCPTPPVTSIDPLSTLSPLRASRRSKLQSEATQSGSPRPADILAGVKRAFWEHAGKDCNNGEHSASTSVASPPETATSSTQSRLPSMGTFKPVSGDPKRSAVIDGSKKVVFSPFSRHGNVRKRIGRGRKRTAAGSDIFPYTSKRLRQSSLPDSSRALLPVEGEESASPIVQSSPELPVPTAPIDLDDVLDAAFLDSDSSGEAAANTSGERHLRNLTRWDRIPMGTFRRSRIAHMDENTVRVSMLALPNDGVSYGSAGGNVLRKTPLGAALWQTNSSKTSRQPSGTIPVSPVIFPQQDGERTPTSQFPDPLQKPLPGDAGSSKSRKQKRKEKKKKKRVSASTATSHGFYHVSANVSPLTL